MCGVCTADPDAVVDLCPPVYGDGAASTASTIMMTNLIHQTIIIFVIIITTLG